MVTATLLGCMRTSVKSFLIVLVMAGMTCFTGCISFPKDMVTPAVELQQATLNFRLAEKHWPKDYEELSGFLKRSHDPTYASLQAVKFHRLDFVALPDGGIKVDMRYTTASGDATLNMGFWMGKPTTYNEDPGNSN